MPGHGLIVNADDFGLSSAINLGIVKGYRHGIVTSTSLAAVGDAFAEAVALSQAHPGLDIGLHLTLVGEKALLGHRALPTLTDAEGRFPGHATVFCQRLLTGKIAREEIRKELDAQLQCALDHGVVLSHLDSHQHVHVLPGVLRIVHELAQKYRISALRLPREPVAAAALLRGRQPGRALMQAVLWGLCQWAGHPRLLSPTHFRGFADGGKLTRERLRYLLERLPKSGVTEIMCHPGLGEQHSPYRAWGYRHAAELQALCDPQIRELLRQTGIRLLSFRELVSQG